MKSSIAVPQKSKIELSYNPTPGVHLKEWKPGYNSDICTPMYIATLLTRASYGNS
jgi:hypothetical protein